MRGAARLLGPAVLGLVAAGLTQSTVTKRIDPATTGALTGRAVFNDVPPPRASLNMSANPVCVQRAGPRVEGEASLGEAGGSRFAACRPASTRSRRGTSCSADRPARRRSRQA